MSKSLGNYIGVTEPPEEMYGKTMRIPDEALGDWYELLLGAEPPAGRSGPRDAKRALARALVDALPRRRGGRGGRGSTSTASTSSHEAPDDMPRSRVRAGRRAPSTCRRCSARAFGISRSEARRLIAQGGVRLDGEPLGRRTLDVAGRAARRRGAAGRQAPLRARCAR